MNGPAAEDRGALLEAAEQRLLDAALDEALASHDAAGSGRAPAPSRWLAAATLLLGVGVVAASLLWRAGSDRSVATPQDPLPEAVVVRDPARLAEVDGACENLALSVAVPGDLAGLGRFARLRALELTSVLQGDADLVHDDAAWEQAGAEAFDALLQCPALERVSIGFLGGLDPAAIRSLGGLPKLREIALTGVRHLVDAGTVESWGRLDLRRLRLDTVRVAPAGLEAIGRLPVLEDLDLDTCLHVDRCDLRHLLRLKQLRRLSLGGIGGDLSDSLQKMYPLPGEHGESAPVELGPEVLRLGGLYERSGELRRVLGPDFVRGLDGLPLLRELSLSRTVVDDGIMAALPARLRRLDVGDAVGLTPAAVRGLERMGGLEELKFAAPSPHALPGQQPIGRDEFESAWRAVLPRLPLQRLDYHGRVSPSLAEGIAGCKALRSLSVVAGEGEQDSQLAFLRSLEQLEQLRLMRVRIDVDLLRDLPALRRLEVGELTAEDEAALREAFCGDGPQGRPDGAPRLEVVFG